MLGPPHEDIPGVNMWLNMLSMQKFDICNTCYSIFSNAWARSPIQSAMSRRKRAMTDSGPSTGSAISVNKSRRGSDVSYSTVMFKHWDLFRREGHAQVLAFVPETLSQHQAYHSGEIQ